MSKPNNFVVHCKKSIYDVYIGRGKCPKTGKQGIWGNPFMIGVDGDRDEVIEKYKKWILKNKELLKKVWRLHGKVLGCWCSPQACHGDVLVELADIEFEKRNKNVR